ncbi:MAG: hypothetical protein ACR2OD_03450 [Gaiellaceae bacterium]
MSFGLLFLGFVAVTNFARVAFTLRRSDAAGVGKRAVVSGVLLVFVACAVIAALSDAILDGLNVSHETFALAGAAVVAVMGLRVVAFPEFRDLPEFAGFRAALIPVAIPLLFTPELAMLTVTAATREGIGETLAALVLALVLVLVAARVARQIEGSRIAFSVGARILGAIAVFVGVAIALDAIYDV